MPKRKLFRELSKSQKNRRLRQQIIKAKISAGINENVEQDCIQRNSPNFDKDCVQEDIPNSEEECGNEFGAIYAEYIDVTSDSDDHSEIEDFDEVIGNGNQSLTFKEEIAQWICHYNISHEASRVLLKILKNSDLSKVKELPSDPRTLLGTPETTVTRNIPPDIQLPMMKYKNVKLYENKSDLDQSDPQSCCAQMDLSQKLDAIYALQFENKKYMDYLLRKVETVNLLLVDRNKNKPENATHSTTNLKSSLGLPIASPSELMGFENNLKEDTTTRSQYRSLIKKLGGGNYEKVTRNALLATLNPEMAYKCTWTGANNSIKMEGTEFMNLLIDTVVNNNENSTNDAVRKIIKTWLQKAGDRLPKSTTKKNLK